MSTDLDVDVKQALVRRRGQWRDVAARSGVSYSWISKFVNGHIPNPGIETLRQLRGVLNTDGAPVAAGTPASEPVL